MRTPEVDDDNLQGAFKAVRDQVAVACGVDDGSEVVQVGLQAEEREGVLSGDRDRRGAAMTKEGGSRHAILAIDSRQNTVPIYRAWA